LRAAERGRAAPEARLGEADEYPWANFRGDADFALDFDRAGRRVNLGRARLVVRDEHDAALADDERHDLLALSRVLLFGVLNVFVVVLVRGSAFGGLVLAAVSCLLFLIRFARAVVNAQQVARRDGEGDRAVCRRVVPLVEAAHAHGRRVAPARGEFGLVGDYLKSLGGAAAVGRDFDRLTLRAVGADRRDA